MRKLFFAVATCVLLGSGAFAANLDRGTKEIGLSGLLDFDTANDTRFAADVSYGYFIADGLEVGAQANVDTDDLVTLWGFGGFAEYNFDLGSPLVPFGGLSLDFVSADIDGGEDNQAINLGVDAGVKYFLTENLAISSQAEFDVASDDVYAEDNGVDNTNWKLTFGLRYFFD